MNKIPIIKKFGNKLAEVVFTRNGSKVIKWDYNEDVSSVTFKYHLRLINKQTLERIIKYTERYHGNVRMYPEEYSTVVEFKVLKMTIEAYRKKGEH